MFEVATQKRIFIFLVCIILQLNLLWNEWYNLHPQLGTEKNNFHSNIFNINDLIFVFGYI